ncbi:helix-turn-helix transcriptional regulator [Yersinia enterocolitica]|nr:helix-turn-helix transcriptional regulator [Yersinia enterocolitica]EME2526592.1 helix-turn-helix transcriptional regulator [Yersinia enterocolitica]
MNGYELRLWRKGLYWEQERAAEELGVSRRAYQYYEKNGPPMVVILATKALSLKMMWPEISKIQPLTEELRLISTLVPRI